ncbi:Hypothetical protein ORPV_539 [Orpheovirus IHUMI-LCC2]|uniref:Uncharacterized protein n=1 Tax=Orpheovirus IHUMI-LCC2 TaxID=2023057 RepID=A0A2I2L4I4_9VIRU|nr:Hypothetical protein ORPV_539 [Orpheovirus IHUMI-LCC2]SNW62443.1 Hypothetical protein ORPV_539 [Orpheovirus IHUMI-LCC2]
MYKVINQTGEVLLDLLEPEYNILLDRINLFMQEEKIVINDEYCGNKEYSILGVKTLLRLLNFETIDDVEELIYCLILISAFDPNFTEKERKHIKYESHRHGLYHICGGIYRNKDMIMTNTIELKANDIDVGFESWMLYNIENVFYFKDILFYRIGKKLLSYNLITGIKKLLISGKNIDDKYKLSFYTLNNELYIHIYFEEDKMGGGIYKIHMENKTMELIKMDILTLKWLIYLYNMGETICYNGRFIDLYRKYNIGNVLCELSYEKKKSVDMRKLLYYNFPDDITRKIWGCKNIDINICGVDHESIHFESYIDEMTDGTIKKGSVINILMNINGEILRESCDLVNYVKYSPYHKYFVNNDQLCTLHVKDFKFYINIYEYI